MNKSFVKGIWQGLGILLVFSVMGIVFASGWHTASEIVSGTFIGDYWFNGTLSINSTPTANDNVATKAYVDAAAGGSTKQNATVFTSSGTWDVPEGIEVIEVLAIGGGGSGAASASGYDSTGGSGGEIVFQKVSVEGLDNVTITIGSGGAGKWASANGGAGTNGGAGGSTTFGSLLIARGGAGGIRTLQSASPDGGLADGKYSRTYGSAGYGGNTVFANGGGTADNTKSSGGGAGYGAGGAGTSTANAGSGGLGAGGGGYMGSEQFYQSGSGGAGIVIIYY